MEPLEDIIKRLGDADQVVAFKAYQALLKVVMEDTRPGKEASRAKTAATLAAEVMARVPGGKDDKGKEKPPVPKYAAPVRIKTLRLLSYVATPKEVPTFVQACDDLDLREMARFALDGNTADEATKALIEALEKVGPEFRIGVVNALGKRKGPEAIKILQKAADDSEPEVAMAAIEALAGFPDPSSDPLLAKAAECDCPKARNRANVARIRLAETLRLAGNKAAAKGIYSAILAGKADKPQRKAAELALKALA
jgi:hypothetical protein